MKTLQNSNGNTVGFLNEGSPCFTVFERGWLKSSKNEPESVKQPLEIVVSRP